MKKIISIITGLAIVLVFAGQVLAAKPTNKPAPAEKTTGTVSYDAYGLYRTAVFNAHESVKACGYSYSAVGNWIIDFEYQGLHYPHEITVNPDVTGNGGWPTIGSPSYWWHIINMDIIGNQINLVTEYDGAPDADGAITNLIGTINLDGSMNGNWNDNYPPSNPLSYRAGVWTASVGSAKVNNTNIICDGKGEFHYSDVAGNWYNADVKYVRVEGVDAWFGALATDASDTSWVGNWVFVKTHDGGEPAVGVDQVWGSFVSESAAKIGVATMATPGDGSFTVTEGNLQVHTY